MTFVGMGSAGSDRNPDDGFYGGRHIRNEPGMPQQLDGAACFDDLIKAGDGRHILQSTVDTGEPMKVLPGEGAITVRKCGRTACQAQCGVMIGAYFSLKRVDEDPPTAPLTACEKHPVRSWYRRVAVSMGAGKSVLRRQV